MGKYRSLIFFVAALFFAGIAGLIAINYLSERERSLEAEFNREVDYTEVIVATRELIAGDVLDTTNLSIRPIPTEYVPDTHFSPNEFAAIDGMLVVSPVGYGKPLLRSQVKGLAGVQKFSELLKPGERAVTLKVSSLDTSEYMLVPGDYVDIALQPGGKLDRLKDSVRQDTDGIEVRQLKPLLDKVLVLATGVLTVADPIVFNLDTRIDGYETITIGVDLKNVAKLYSAMEQGDLKYLIRNPNDSENLEKFLAGAASIDNAVTVITGGSAEQGLLKTTAVVTAQPGVTTFLVDDETRFLKRYQPDSIQPRQLQKINKDNN